MCFYWQKQTRRVSCLSGGKAGILLTAWTLAVSLVTMASTTYSTCSFQPHEDGLHADCSHRQLTSLPSTWPDDVVWLDMSHNQLSVLTNMSHPHLAHLRHLDLSHNQLHQSLANHTFAPLQQLRWLSLHDNRLQSLQVDAMTGLGQLTFLDMSNNQLLLDYHSYPPGVFHPLTSLQELKLHGNDDRWVGEYPEDIFRPLSSLQTLSLDTFSDTQFGSEFAVLTNIKILHFPDSRLKYLRNTTFSAFHNSSLEEIHITGHSLTEIEICAFCHLPNLKELHIWGQKYISVLHTLESLYGLQHQDMRVIEFYELFRRTGVTINKHSARFLMTICVSKLTLVNLAIDWITNDVIVSNPLATCLQEIDFSMNRVRSKDIMGFLTVLTALKHLVSFTMVQQEIYTMELASSILRQNTGCTQSSNKISSVSGIMEFHLSPSIQYLNFSSGLYELGTIPPVVKLVGAVDLRVVDFSRCRISNCNWTVKGITKLETMALSGNNCFYISEAIFDYGKRLRRLELSNVNVNPEFFRTRAWRLFRNLELLQTLDLSLNNLIHVDPHMLRAQRHLKELNLAGNRLQSMSVDLESHQDLVLLDLSHNMLPTLLPNERQALDTLAATHNLSLRLRGNPLLCACSNLDFVRWLWSTAAQLDGDGSNASNYTCVTETGEVSNTHSVMAHYDTHWRRCVGQTMLGVASAAFLLQLLVLVIVYVVSHSWTHLRYVWKVMKRLRLPRREHFRRDAYVGYADADWEFACVTLPACLEERHGVRLLLRDREELPGSIRAENILQHIDDSWKVLLLVTRDFAMDEWLCGFTVQQAQRSIIDTMPDRVIVVFMEDPARLPPMASLERLLRMVPERNVLHVRKDTPPHHAVWGRLAKFIIGENRRQ